MRTTRTLSRSLLAAAATLLAAVSPAGAADTLKIGVLTSMTGGLAAYGPPILNGALLAESRVNEAGGVLGAPVRIVSRDDQTDPTAAVDAAQKLVSIDRVTVIVGALSSGVTIPVATSVTVPNGVLQISPASTSPEITALADRDLLFRTVPSDALQCSVLAALAKERGFGRTAVIHVNNSYGEGLAGAYRAAFEAAGGTVTATVAFNPGQASYRSEVQKALGGRADALVVVAYPEEGVKIVRQAIEFGLANRFLFPDGMKAPEVISSVGARHLEGTWGTAPAAASGALTAAFAEAYAARWGQKPPKPYIDTAFDAVILAALAAARAGAPDGAALRDSLREVANPPGEKVDFTSLERAFAILAEGGDIDYEGVSGPVDLDRSGDVTGGSYGIWAIEGGAIRDVRVELVR